MSLTKITLENGDIKQDLESPQTNSLLIFTQNPWHLRVRVGATLEIQKPDEDRPVALHGTDGREFWVAEDEEHIHIWRPGYRFSLELSSHEGEASIASLDDWQNILRPLFFFDFLESNGLLLHAASVVKSGKAFVFPGPSESGKTTIVRNSPGLPILTDEISAVQLVSPSLVLAWGTPFYGDWGQPGEEIQAPVPGLFFPTKSPEHKIIPLNRKETLKRLLPCIYLFTTWQPRLNKIFELTANLAESIPGFLMHFRPHPSLWEMLDAS